MSTILVTGATGNVGSELLTQLDVRANTVLAFVRHIPTRRVDGVDYRIGDFADAASLDAALADVDAVFLACPNSPDQVEFETRVLDRATRAGVAHLVKLSAYGAAADSDVAFWRWHATIENELVASGLSHTVLRPYFSMANLLGALMPARELGMLFAPLGDARVAMIDPREVAAIAAQALTSPHAVSRVVTLAGPEPLTHQDVADRMTVALGRPVIYQDVPTKAARDQIIGSGTPEFVADQIITLYAHLRAGMQATADHGESRRTNGGAPHTLADYLVRVTADAETVRAAGPEQPSVITCQ